MVDLQQGDIHYVEFESQGTEIQKRRPALVLSRNYVNSQSGNTYMAPITSTDSNFPLAHQLETISRGIHGKVKLAQVKSMDPLARNISEKVDEVDKDELRRILNKFKLIFSMENPQTHPREMIRSLS